MMTQSRWMVCVAVTVLLTGCSANYTGERLFWKAQQLNKTLLKDAQRSTPEQFAKVIQAFERVVDKAPGTSWAPKAHLAVGMLHVAQKNYDKARDAWQQILQNYSREGGLTIQARVLIAKSYEAETKWDEAIKAYEAFIDYHPWSRPGLEAPLYIARLREKLGQPDQAARAYERALRLYTKMVPDAPSPEMTTQVKHLIAVTHQRLGHWNEAIASLEEVLASPSGANRPLALLTLGVIYETKLQSPEQARDAYAKLVEEFPEHPFGKAAKTQLDRLTNPAGGLPQDAPSDASLPPVAPAPVPVTPAAR